MKRRLLASVLAASMAFSSFTFVTFADEADQTDVIEVTEEADADAAEESNDEQSSDEAVGDTDEDLSSEDAEAEADDAIEDDSIEDDDAIADDDALTSDSSEADEEAPAAIEDDTNADLEADPNDLNKGDWIAGYTRTTNTGYTLNYGTDADQSKYLESVSFNTFDEKGGGLGKFTNGEEALVYAVKELSRDLNFTLEADITFNRLFSTAKNPNQSSAGIMLFRDPLSAQYKGDDGYRWEPSISVAFNANSSKKDTKFIGRLRDVGQTVPTSVDILSAPDLEGGGEEDLGSYHLSIEKSADAYTLKVSDNNDPERSGITYFSSKTLFKDDILYAGFFASRGANPTFTNIKITRDPRQFTDVQLTSPPTRTEYYLDQAFDNTGLEVYAKWTDADTGEPGEGILGPEDCSIMGFDTSTVTDGTPRIVQIGKAGLYHDVEYTVRKIRLTNVNVTTMPYKNVYYDYQYFLEKGLVGQFEFENGTTEKIQYIDEFDENGLVIGSHPNYEIYMDGKRIYNEETIFRAAQAGKKTLEFRYISTDRNDANGVVATMPIEIKPHVLQDISITAPTKVDYAVGEDFIDSGLKVTGTYVSGSEKIKSDMALSGFDITGFDTSEVGEKTITLTLKSNPAISKTFKIRVTAKRPLEMLITQYPRTTFTNNMTKSEIEDAILSRIKVSIRYNNDTIELTKMCDLNDKGQFDTTTGDYTVDLSKIQYNNENGDLYGKDGVYRVTVTPTSPDFKPMEFDVTIRSEKTHYWRRTIQGQSSGSSTWTNLEEPDEYGFVNSINLKSWDGAGKITSGGNDGIVYYYTRFDTHDENGNANNFTLSGDVEVVRYLPDGGDKARSGQEGFGIQFRDTISLLPRAEGEQIAATYGEDAFDNAVVKDNGQYKDSDFVPVAKPSEAMIDKYGEPVPIRNNSTQEYSNMILAGGQMQNTYPTDPNSSTYYFRTHCQRMNMYIRTGVTEAFSTNQTNLVNYGHYCLYGDKGDEPTGDFYPKTGDIYRITLSRINGGYYEEATIVKVGPDNQAFTDWEGKTFSFSWYWGDEGILTDPLLDNDPDNMYAGFCAARWAEINVSNIEYYDSAASTDKSYKGESDDISSPTISITTPLYTKQAEYTLGVKVNTDNGGLGTIKVNDLVVADNDRLSKAPRNYPLHLDPNSVNKVVISFTPDKNDTLSSYDTVTLTKYITVCSDIYSDTEPLYVAPDVEYDGYKGVYGTPKGTGERTSPINLDSAIDLVKPGQKIIVLDGTYYRNDTVTLSTPGRRDKMKYMWADTGANPIFDMQDGPEGLHMNADWWWVKGLTFTNAKDNNKGGGLAASDCIIENCKFHDNGTTGFQVSGSGSDTFDKWPARNLILNCEVWNNHDSSMNNADGFGCKLTVGNGNIFKGCVSHHNLDDGWDFYTKTISGYIGATVLEDCISYKCTYYLNPDGSDTKYAKGSGNGFKMGGDSMYGQHYLKNCFAFQNLANGFDSNANPAMKLRNCVSYDNQGSNYGLTTGLEVSRNRYNYNLDGCLSYHGGDNIGTFNRDTEKVDLIKYDENGKVVTDKNGNEIKVTTPDGSTIPVPKYTNTAEVDLTVARLKEQYPDNAQDIENWSKTRVHISDLKAVADDTNAKLKAIVDLIYVDKSMPILSETNYLNDTNVSGDRKANGRNSLGEVLDESWFVSTNLKDMLQSNGRIAQDAEGNYLRKGVFVRSDKHPYTYAADGSDDVRYPEVYYIRYPDAPRPVDPDQPTTPDTPSGPGGSGGGSSSSGGGGGGGSASKGSSAATTKPADDKTEATEGTEGTEATEGTEGAAGTEGTEGTAGSANTAVSGDVEKAQAVAAETGLADIVTRPWAAEAIGSLSKAGIIKGVSATAFNPDAKITRGDFCVIIARALGYDGTAATTSSFGDVDAGKYYANYIGYVADKGIVNGYDDGGFKPENSISRQEMMVVVARFLGADGTTDTAALNVFPDKDSVAAWAAPYVAYLVDAGIVSGTDTGLMPTDNITRAQAAVLVYNAIKDTLGK